MSLKEKIALITGSTRGIGKEIAAVFAKAGATVIVSGTTEAAALKASEQLQAQGFPSSGFACDITNSKSVDEMVNKILDKYKRIDILVNNAGITRDNLLLRMKEDEWDAVLNTNLKGTFNCTKAVTKAMLKAKAGKVVCISSVIGVLGNAGQANYAASKAGIIGFMKSSAREFASRGITINAVAPGYIETDMTSTLNEKVRQEILKNIPLQRLGTPTDVAGVCLFLASKESDYITGQTFLVDGGMAM